MPQIEVLIKYAEIRRNTLSVTNQNKSMKTKEKQQNKEDEEKR